MEMEGIKLRKSWEDIPGFTYEEVMDKVENIFSKWEKENLKITYGKREHSVSDTYGLPYTSSSEFASVGCHCNVNAVLKSDNDFVIYEIAISEDNEVIAYFTDADENPKLVKIGKLERTGEYNE